jgi:hypothetical protein
MVVGRRTLPPSRTRGRQARDKRRQHFHYPGVSAVQHDFALIDVKPGHYGREQADEQKPVPKLQTQFDGSRDHSTE